MRADASYRARRNGPLLIRVVRYIMFLQCLCKWSETASDGTVKTLHTNVLSLRHNGQLRHYSVGSVWKIKLSTLKCKLILISFLTLMFKKKQ